MTSSKEEKALKKIFRKLAYFYMHSILPKQILHSRKINPELRESHLKMGEDLLRAFRSFQAA